MKISHERLKQFMEVYVPALYDAVEKYPAEYAYSPELVPSTANKMRDAIIKGSYNKDGRAFRAACKKLGIAFTYKSLNDWFTTSPAELKARTEAWNKSIAARLAE